MDIATLRDALGSVIAIPILPFKGGQVDYDGHLKNVDYLMNNNYLDHGRKRVIAVAGTSLIDHVDFEERTKIVDQTGQRMGNDGILISALAPNPIGTAGRLIEAQSKLKRPPDAYLIMHVSGTTNPEGMYQQYMAFGEKYGERCGARFLYYFRRPRDREAIVRLFNDSPYFVAIKIGTDTEDVKYFVDGVGDNALVIWGIGDRSTAAAEQGAKGHTSGIAVVCARASDEIDNAQRRGDYETAYQIEAEVGPLEEIRFYDGRKYNYSAVVEAIKQGGFHDVVAGEGGPFNPPVPPHIVEQVKKAVEPLRKYH